MGRGPRRWSSAGQPSLPPEGRAQGTDVAGVPHALGKSVAPASGDRVPAWS